MALYSFPLFNTCELPLLFNSGVVTHYLLHDTLLNIPIKSKINKMKDKPIIINNKYTDSSKLEKNYLLNFSELKKFFV